MKKEKAEEGGGMAGFRPGKNRGKSWGWGGSGGYLEGKDYLEDKDYFESKDYLKHKDKKAKAHYSP